MSNQSEASPSQRKEVMRTAERQNQSTTGPKSSRVMQMNEAHKQVENSQLSQSLQNMITSVQACEAARQIDESNIKELSISVERQQQNYSELLSERDQFKFRFETEMKSQEAILTKHRKLMQMFNLLTHKFNSVTSCLQKTVDVQNSNGKVLAMSKERLQHMNISYETMNNVSIPQMIEHLRLQLLEGKERDRLNSIEIEELINNNLKQSELEETMANEHLSKTLLCDMHNQILAENEESQNLMNNEARIINETEEQKQFLKHRVEILTEEDNRAECDINVASEEMGKFTLKTKNQHIELLQQKEREGSLCAALETMKVNVEHLSGSLSKIRISSEDLSKQLDDETKKSSILKIEFDGIKLQLQEIEMNINCRINDLTGEISQVSASATDMEESLQNELDNARVEETNNLQEEEGVQQSLTHMEGQMKQIHATHGQTCQSIADLEKNLADGEKELINVKEEQRNLTERLEAVRCETQTSQQSLTQTKANNENRMSELENQLASIKQVKCQASDKFHSLNLMEQELINKIAEAQRVSAYSDAEMKERHESIIRELQEEVVASESKIESINADSFKELDKLQQKKKHLIEVIENKNIELNSHKDSIQKCRSDLEDLKVSLQDTLNQKEKQDTLINDLTSRILRFAEREELQNTEGQTMALKLEQIQRRREETDTVISSLEIKYQQLLTEAEKAASDHKTEKQVFNRDLVRFQQTAQCRTDGEKSLIKQIGVWKEKYEEVHQQLTELSSAVELKALEAKQAQEKLNDVERELQTAKGRQLSAEQLLIKAEKDSHHAKKKLDSLRSKIDERRAAKKKEQEKGNVILNLPTQEEIPLKQTTPQQLASKSDDKENTPRSILKSSSKPSTPHKTPPTPLKTVKFSDIVCYDSDNSSTSTIVMVPEITERLALNPRAGIQIQAEIRERRLAEKKIRNQQEINQDTFKIPSQEIAPFRNTIPQHPVASQEHKTHTFDDDYDDGASSSSSIVMVPELTDRIALNPGAIHQIVAEHRENLRIAKIERKRRQEEMDNEAFKLTGTSKDVTPSRHTTPQFALGHDDKDITPRSILKSSSNPPTPQKKTVKFADASSSSTVEMDYDVAERLGLDAGAAEQQAAEPFAAKRRKLSSWDNSTSNEISSSTPEK